MQTKIPKNTKTNSIIKINESNIDNIAKNSNIKKRHPQK